MLAASWVLFMIRDAGAPYRPYWRPLFFDREFLCLMRTLSDRLKLGVGAYRLEHERAKSDGV
jgi:hypothetical protein